MTGGVHHQEGPASESLHTALAGLLGGAAAELIPAVGGPWMAASWRVEAVFESPDGSVAFTTIVHGRGPFTAPEVAGGG